MTLRAKIGAPVSLDNGMIPGLRTRTGPDDPSTAMASIRTTECGSIYTRDRSKNLWIRFQGRDGTKIRKSSGTSDVDEAEKILAQEVKWTQELTFQLAAVDFFETNQKNLKPKTLTGYTSLLRSVDRTFGKKRLSEIHRESLKAFVAKRRREVSDATVRRELALISSIYSHAVNHMPMGPESNPVLAFSKRELKEKPRTRWLTGKEYTRLLDACWEDMHRHIVTVACQTGMRTGELTGLRKSMIFLDRKEVVLPARLTKNGKPRVIPLLPEALYTLEKVCTEAQGDLVFWNRNNPKLKPKPYTAFNRFFRGARRRANLNDVRFHDLRHTFASWWVQSGGDLMVLRDILGHQSMKMVERYAYLDTKSAHRAIAELTSVHTLNTLRK